MLKTHMVMLRKITLRLLLCILFLSVNTYSFSENIKDSNLNRKLDFNFQNCNLDRALKMISDETGIHFFINGYYESKIFNKSFRDETIEEIIDDLLKESSYSVLWRYSDDVLVSAGIWVFDENIKPGEFREMNHFSVSKVTDNVQKKSEQVLWSTSDKKDINVIDKDYKEVTNGNENAGDRYASVKNDKYGFSGRKRMTSDRRKNRRNNVIKRKLKKKSSLVDTSITGKNKTYPEIPPMPEKYRNIEPPPMPPDFDYRGNIN